MDESKGVLATVIALFGLLMLMVAFLAGFNAVGGSDFASKFENGEWPPDADVSGLVLVSNVAF